MTDREQIAKILCENIHYSGQANDYIIHGAIEKIIEWQHGKERDFKLLVREYFQQRTRYEFAKDRLTLNQSAAKATEAEKRILTELERFTLQDVKELPFKD